ncbi:MAG TPA: pyridoxamine 5'-phosphate oxidase [Sphingobacterium sp.]|nr:pyridoxamine 5'-phosphate oxidase [Sphingobacterium sp.]
MAIEYKDIAAIREDYAMSSLNEDDIDPNPFRQFMIWFDQARESNVMEPNAMVLSTISSEGFPSSRVVLLKDIKTEGLSFFTNYDSQKGQDLLANSKTSLLFFWAELQRQVRIEGLAEKLPMEDSDEYFASRPRGSQIGAWSSPQSRIIENRHTLETAVQKTDQRFAAGSHVPRPDFWGGYVIKPLRFEFWQGRSSRLHDRILFRKEGSVWTINRLAP